MPKTLLIFAAASAALPAAKGVDFLLPLYPIAPLDDQARAFPSTSENVVIVLLKVEVICAHPSGIFFLTFLFLLCILHLCFLLH